MKLRPATGLVLAGVLAVVVVVFSITAWDRSDESTYRAANVKKAFTKAHVPLVRGGIPVGEEERRAAPFELQSTDLQIFVWVYRTIGEARTGQRFATDDVQQVHWQAIGADMIVLRNGNVLVLYDQAKKPDRLTNVRAALDHLEDQPPLKPSR